jgi:adenosylhomocysteine nucleosidase
MKTVVLVSANEEWRAVRGIFPDVTLRHTPYGETFNTTLEGQSFVFFHGGWGKIAAAGSTQYVIDRFQPELLVNLGTCGGIEGQIERGAIVLVEKTVVYDILEQMGDPEEAIDYYATDIDLMWLKRPYPLKVERALLVSGDRDLVASEIEHLKRRYLAVAGDWESGAIAWVAARNNVCTLILRGVTDLVSSAGGEAYGNLALFKRATREVMQRLVKSLPGWIPKSIAPTS